MDDTTNIVNESDFPCLYAMGYILAHGEHTTEALRFTQEQFETARALELRLAAIPFIVVAKYATTDEEAPDLADMHANLKALGFSVD
jgi:hypothetical protein